MSVDNRLVGAIDQGTVATKFLLFDHDSTVVEQVSMPHEQIYPQSGWVEHDPVEIKENTEELAKKALESARRSSKNLAAIGITNQRETVVVWDRETGEPIHNALVWQDRRATDRIERLRSEGWSEYVQETTGLEMDAFFSAGKLEWVLDTVSEARERAADGDLCFGTIDSWLVYNLTGKHVTDVTNASRTMLFDIHTLDWDTKLLNVFDVPRAMLPTVCPSIASSAYGSTAEDGFLGSSVPVTGVLGDQHAASVGHAGFDPGSLKHSIGTSSVMHLNTGAEAFESTHGLNTTIGFQIEGEDPMYVLEGQVFTGGQTLEWLVEIGVLDSASNADEFALSVQSTDGVYFVPAFQGLATPFWDTNARGTIHGLSRDTTPAHLVRAAINGVAFRSRDALDAMRADSNVEANSLRVDGGMTNSEYFCQQLADLTGLRVEQPAIKEITSLGAAYAAGLAAEYWSDAESIRAQWQVENSYEPSSENSGTTNERYSDWKTAIETTQKWGVR